MNRRQRKTPVYPPAAKRAKRARHVTTTGEKAVAILDVSDPVRLVCHAGRAVHDLFVTYGREECSPDGLAEAALVSLGILHKGEYLRAIWRQHRKAKTS
jgi:hypothetical protein